MKHFYDLNGVVSGPTRVAFGGFDGLHLGHRAVLRRLRGYEGQIPVVVSFAEEERPVIYTESEKEYLLSGMPVEIMVSLSRAMVDAMTAEDFCRKILCSRLQAKTVVAGENLCFGSDKKGRADLIALGQKYGFSAEIVPTVTYEGEPVTTGAVKQAVAAGDFRKMAALLGHPYVMQGTVVHGKAAGRRHGMPTANLGVAENKLFPPHGVYGALAYLDGAFFRGMTNVGFRPSDDDIPIATIETWLLNFDRDIYGKKLTLELYSYIRGVRKFNGLDEVRRQIDADVLTVQSDMDRVVEEMRV